MPIPTRRHIEYAQGYLALGMPKEAEAELNAVVEHEQEQIEVLRLRVDLHLESKRWAKVLSLAPSVCKASPESEATWIAWAFALHELKRTGEAQSVLLKAEPFHGSKSAVLHYNLACYACMLGQLDEAKRRLSTASKMDQAWLQTALDDPDLQAMRDHVIKLLQQAS